MEAIMIPEVFEKNVPVELLKWFRSWNKNFDLNGYANYPAAHIKNELWDAFQKEYNKTVYDVQDMTYGDILLSFQSWAQAQMILAANRMFGKTPSASVMFHQTKIINDALATAEREASYPQHWILKVHGYKNPNKKV